MQVSPTELVLKPGQTVKLHAKLFDAKGRFLREEPAATWSLQGLKGTVADGSFTVAADPVEQAGTIKATVGAISPARRARASCARCPGPRRSTATPTARCRPAG